MTDPEQPSKKTTIVQNRIALPFIIVIIALLLLAPVLTITRSPYADDIMPVVIVLLAACAGIILLYNKTRLGV